jgi:hypothetical protein
MGWDREGALGCLLSLVSANDPLVRTHSRCAGEEIFLTFHGGKNEENFGLSQRLFCTRNGDRIWCNYPDRKRSWRFMPQQMQSQLRGLYSYSVHAGTGQIL